MDEVSHALGRIEGCLQEMRCDISEIKTTQTDMVQRVSKIEMKIVGVSSVVAFVSSIVAAKARAWLGGGGC